MTRFKVLSILFFITIFSNAWSQKKPAFLENYNKKWVDSTFQTLSLDEKIGQLLMPRGNTSGKGYNPDKVKQWVKDYKIGGLVFFAGQPTVQANLVNELQAMSKVPMLIGMDLEWGLAMRLDSTPRFPYQMALGAMQGNDSLIYQMGVEIAKQCKRMGVHINYAPVVDVNLNPKNPVINFRSFGEDKNLVAQKALAFMTGMQSQNILTSAKHFPGHGDTQVDSHYDLPLINHDIKQLEEIDIYPFKQLIDNGLSGVMTSHLSIPALDTTKNLAATFSKKIVIDLLRKKLKFEGLTFTDAMDMQGAVKFFPNGEALVKAILAGNDILETFEDVPTAVNAIKNAIQNNILPMSILDERVIKILKAKSWVGLDRYQAINTQNLTQDLNTIQSDYLNRLFAQKTLVVLKNQNQVLPIKDLIKPTVVISIDANDKTDFQKMSANYLATQNINFPVNTIIDSVRNIISSIDVNANIIVGLHLQNIRPSANYGINENNMAILKAILDKKPSTLVIFGNPYALDKIDNLDMAQSIIMANQLTKYTEEAAAQAVFGAIEVNGKLPVTVNSTFVFNQGESLKPIGRLAYGIPEMVGLDSKVFIARLDSVANLGLNEKAYPGAVLEVAKNGMVIYQKAFGFHTYEDAKNLPKNLTSIKFENGIKTDVMDNGKLNLINKALAERKTNDIEGKTKVDDIYDLASVTKVSTSLLAVMELMTKGQFDLDKTYGDYYEPFRNSNKANLKFRDMLTHRSGLKAWIPFWMDCIDTTATLKKAIHLHPELANNFDKIYHKANFFQKLFHVKPKYNLDYLGSIKKDKNLWLKALGTQSIVWKPGIFSNNKSDVYSVEVADTLFMNKDRMAFIMNQIKDSPVNPNQGYVYSDLHYYTYPAIISKIVGKDWETFLKETYNAIGANTLTYNPRRFFDLNRIVPTERDTLFRKTLIHGRVHDEGAGLLQGISGHAGLFGSANDLTKLMQMYLQKGEYGGQRFISEKVIEECTKYQFPAEGNRRAIAFDKLDFNKSISNSPQMASDKSYGHSGYTGTFTWIDPEYNLVYVFLSNRVYPTRDNNKISSLNIRTEIGNQIIKTILHK